MITKVCAFFQEIRKVVDDIGPEHIVHIVTDNGANYIVWTPCLVRTVNLMLKDIGQRPEHQGNDHHMQANFNLVKQSWSI
jgi:hypothetical protein